ncbi:hypothetical protein B0H14DRAFT_3885311 [Mycena olivaceomarginata]|nr:hypothetical protein B0H14DRAFT_3885311 [Mycena olivaceomarginata]
MSSLLDGSNLRNRTGTTRYASSDLDLDLRSEFEFLPTAAYYPYQLPFPPFISNPRNVAASESSISTSLAQEDSAFNRSATNPYNYPMTQIPPGSGKTNSNLHRLLGLSNKLLLPSLGLGDDAIHSSNTFDHTGTHGGNHGGNFHSSSVSVTAAPTGQGPNLRSRRT